MKLEIGGADTITITSAGALTAGTGTLVGTSIFGVPMTSATGSGELVEIKVQGKVTLAKTSTADIAIGDALYWDDTNKVVNKTTSAQREIGWAISTAGNPSATVDVYLVPTVRTSVAA
jgi:predicted RecA/RadA family phage recombinase